MSTIKSILTAAVVALVVSLGAFYFTTDKSSTAGGTATVPPSGVSHFNAIEAVTAFFEGTDSANVAEVPTVGSCVPTVGTSTEFAVLNPFGATSTATMISVSGMGQSTTTTFKIGTSTSPTGNVNVAFGNFNVATGSPYYVAPGILTGSGSGYLSSGAGTFQTIEVGPNEYVIGSATSTATGGGANAYIPSLSCTYKIQWDN